MLLMWRRAASGAPFSRCSLPMLQLPTKCRHEFAHSGPPGSARQPCCTQSALQHPAAHLRTPAAAAASRTHHAAMLAALVAWVTHLLCPPAKRPALAQAESCFTPAELDALRREYCEHVLAQYSQTIDDRDFLEWAGLRGQCRALQAGVCSALRRESGAGGAAPAAASITLDGIIVAKAMCEKLDRQAALDFSWDVLDVEASGSVSRQHLQEVVHGLLELAGAGTAASCGTSSAEAAAAIAAGACSYSGEDGSVLTRDGYAKLCKESPALMSSLLSLLSNIGRPAAASAAGPAATSAPRPAASPSASSSGGRSQAALAASSAAAAAGGRLRSNQLAGASTGSSGGGGGSRQVLLAAGRGGAAGPGPGSGALAAAAAATARGPGRLLLPQLGWGLCSPDEGLLQPAWVWLLAAGLPPSARQEWRLLFSSTKHGMSFSTFLGRVAEAAPTLLLIRDKGGALFGGIAHAPWQKSGSFYGDHANCVFSLLPHARLWPASGINANLQWCGSGFSELPNGVGFGGQVGHFGAWLDATFDTGMSRPCATYANPSLSSTQTFAVEGVEAWLLVPPEEEADAAASTPGSSSAGLSALDKSKTDRQILDWAGVYKGYATGLRDEPLEED